MVYSRYYLVICLDGLRKIMKILGQYHHVLKMTLIRTFILVVTRD